MGLFGNKEEIDLSDPGQVAIPDSVSSVVPDAGTYLLEWLGDLLDESTHARLAADVDSRRGPNGWLSSAGLADTPPLGRKQTPLTFLSNFVGGRDAIHLQVWGTSASNSRDHKTLGRTLNQLVRTQGHAAAATWAIVARPDARLDLDYLAQSLHEAWYESHSFLQNRDVIKAFKNWRAE